jgi:hypothetical protein
VRLPPATPLIKGDANNAHPPPPRLRFSDLVLVETAMANSTRSLLKTFGTLGPILAIFSTFVAWYSFQAVFTVPAFELWVPRSLWSLYPLAATLITVAALAGLALVHVRSLAQSRAAGAIIAPLGLAIVVYSAVRIFDVPALGVTEAPRPAGYAPLEQHTQLDGGPFLSLAGGFLLTLGSLPMLVAAGERERRFARPARTATGAPHA